MREYGFEKLQVWQEARQLTRMIYSVTASYPNEEKFVITNQMRRAALSVASNISEGSGRTGEKERLQFYRIAYSSLMELLNQLIISVDLEYMQQKDLDEKLRPIIESISSKLYSLKGRN